MVCDKLVSVIVPVYNVRDYLEKCLNSIRKQTYENFEVLLVDDGSTDGSADICDKFQANDSRFISIHKKNGGVSSARNEGLKRAKGEFITFIDSDDSIDINYIEVMADGLEKYNVDFVRVGIKRDGINLHMFAYYESLENHVVDFRSLVDTKMLAAAYAVMIRKNSVEGIYFDKNIYYGEDTLFMVRAFLKSKSKKILLLTNTFYNYTSRNGSAMDTKFNEKWLTFLDAADKIVDMLKPYPFMEFGAKNYKKWVYFSVLSKLLENNVRQYNEKKQIIRQEIITLRKNGCRPKGIKLNLYELSLLYGGYGIVRFARNLKRFIGI